MKAILKSTGEFIEVEPSLSYDGCWLYSFYNIKSHKTYGLWELDVSGKEPENSNEHKRYEIAKSVLPEIIRNRKERDSYGLISVHDDVLAAIRYADELLQKLKKSPDKI